MHLLICGSNVEIRPNRSESPQDKLSQVTSRIIAVIKYSEIFDLTTKL